jgi:hypothetical protein
MLGLGVLRLGLRWRGDDILQPPLLPTALWINSPGHKIAITRQLTALLLIWG